MRKSTKKAETAMVLSNGGANPQKSQSSAQPNPAQPPQKPVEILDKTALSIRLDKTTANISKEIGNVTKSFCRIGFELWKAKEEKLYLV